MNMVIRTRKEEDEESDQWNSRRITLWNEETKSRC